MGLFAWFSQRVRRAELDAAYRLRDGKTALRNQREQRRALEATRQRLRAFQEKNDAKPRP